MNILIFGAGPGLSHSVAKKFGSNGFDVTLVARTESKLIKEVEELKRCGSTPLSSLQTQVTPNR